MSIKENVTPLANSIERAGHRIGLSRATIYNLIAAGQLKTFKLGRRTLIAESELHRFLQERMAGLTA